MLDVHDLTSSYGRVQILHGITLEVRAGEIVSLVGSNGAGKTTLLRVLSGVQAATAGKIIFEGNEVNRLKPHQRVSAGIAQVPEGRQIFAPLSVIDNLKLGAFTRRDPVGVNSDLDEILGMFPVLADKRRLPAGSLSGGQQQMLALGRSLMSRPRLLLLDEPTMGLAPQMIDTIFAIILALKARGLTILLVEQNANDALAVADRGYVIEVGRISLTGTGSDLVADKRVQEAFLGM